MPLSSKSVPSAHVGQSFRDVGSGGSGAYVVDQRVFGVNWMTNRLQSQTHNGGGPVAYQYDDAGNMTIEGQRGFTINPAGQLEKVTDDNSGLVAFYYYDAQGNRVYASAKGTETFYVRDGSGRVLSEFRRPAAPPGPGTPPPEPGWDKDYIYAFGKVHTLVKNNVPAAPRRPWVTGVTTSGLTLHWDPVDDPDLAGYRVYRTWNGVPPPDNEGVLVPQGTSFQDFFDVVPQVVTYAIYAEDSAANLSDPSPTLVVRPGAGTPPAPTSLKGEPGDRRVRLRWVAVNRDDILGYWIERRDPNQAVFVRINSSIIQTIEYTDTGLTNGQGYTYRVIAQDTWGRESVPSAQVLVAPVDNVAPGTPTGVAAQPDLVANTIVVSWNLGAESDLQSYWVYRSTMPSDPAPAPPLQVLASTSVTVSMSDAAPAGSTYYYRVKAVDTSGNASGFSGEVWARPRNGSAPTSLSAAFEVDTRGTTSQDGSPGFRNGCNVAAEDNDVVRVRLVWFAVGGASGYRVYRRPANGSYARLTTDDSQPQPGAGETALCTKAMPWQAVVECVDEATHDSASAYEYYVVALFDAEESVASARVSADDQLPSPFEVRNVTAEDSRGTDPAPYFYNDKSRWVTVMWSRIPEHKLQGYNVYRKCELLGMTCCDFSDDVCDGNWVRLTRRPVAADENSFVDWTVGGLNAVYMYAVRPVGPGYEEGTIHKAVAVNLHPQASTDTNSPHCLADWNTSTYPYRNEYGYCGAGEGCFCHPSLDCYSACDLRYAGCCIDPSVPGTDTMLAAINSVPRGTGSASGPPPPVPEPSPPSPPRTWWVSTKRSFHPDRADLLVAEIPIPYYGALSPTDLAGFRLEIGGSPDGPWGPVTPNLVPWWFPDFSVTGYTTVIGTESGTTGQFSGHQECVHFRVIAVDEEGNESTPAVIYPPYPPAGGCGTGTPPAPQNLVVGTTSGATCGYSLQWDPSPGAAYYHVYRFRIMGGSFFYNTQTLPATSTTYNEQGDPPARSSIPDDDCPYHSTEPPICSAALNCPTGLAGWDIEAFYVTARGATGGESPRSNVVFWSCVANAASNFTASDNSANAIAASAPAVDVPKVGGVCFNDTERREEGFLFGLGNFTEETPTSVSAVCTSTSRRGEKLLEHDFHAATAPMAVLGSLADPPWTVLNLHTDHLGSVRLVTNTLGSVVSQHDYFPFGEEIVALQDYNTHMFTGHERDKETGLDYMFARYYGLSSARFGSPDLLGGHRRNPQSWNRYAYVRNNPITAIDPNGRDVYRISRPPFFGPYPEPVSLDKFQRHDFFVFTKKKGNREVIEKTVSWNNGKWVDDLSKDRVAADKALRAGPAKWLGDERDEKYYREVIEEYNEDGAPTDQRFLEGYTCKDAAECVEKEAKRRKKGDEKTNQQGGSKGPNSMAPDDSICIDGVFCIDAPIGYGELVPPAGGKKIDPSLPLGLGF